VARFFATACSAIALVAVLATPGLSAPLVLDRLRYDDARRTLTVEAPVRPRLSTRLLRDPDRVVVDFPGCVLVRPGIQLAGALGRTVLGVHVLPGGAAQAGIRLVLDCVPGAVSSLATRFEARRLLVVLGASPGQTGESALETLPGGRSQEGPIPPQTLAPPLSSELQGGAAGGVGETPAAAKTPGDPPSPSWVQGAEGDRLASRLTRMWNWPRIVGAGSTFELRWHQIEDVEDDGEPGDPVFGTSTGLQDLRWRHWLWPQVGLGVRFTAQAHDLVAGGRRFSRTESLWWPDVAWRAILGPCEVELNGGYQFRQVRTDGDPGGILRSPLSSSFMQGATWGFTLRTRLTQALALDLGSTWAPSITGTVAEGIPGRFPMSRTGLFGGITVEVEPLTFRIGWEDLTSRVPAAAERYVQSLSGLHVGLGLRY